MSYAQPHRGKEPPLSDYFASPIRTLCESVKDSEQNFISDHDIVEAYNVICWRIRSRKSDIPKMKIEGLFSNFEDDVPLLVQCISRDILRVLPNPFESVPHRGQSVYQSYNTDNATSEDDLAATDHTLCQNALRLMSDLFMFPSLYSMFSHVQVSSLLQDALSLCMPSASWAFDIERLRCTVLLMLKMQQLPLTSIRPDFTLMINALQCVTNVQEVTMSKIDGLTTISSLLEKYPILLLQFISFLPSILNDLKIDDLDVRLAAVHALSGFAHCKHNLIDTSLTTPVFYQTAAAIHTYLTQEHSKTLTPDNSLPLVVKSAIFDDSRFWKKKGPSFAISLVSALVILLDYQIFTSPRSLKLVFFVIQATAGSLWKRVAVHSELWKMLLWSFSRIPSNDEDLKYSMPNGQDIEGWNDTRERAYRVLKQEVRDGIGVAFVAVLLHSQTDGRREIGKALEIIEDMLKCDGLSERADAVLLLERLVNDIGAPLHDSGGERKLYVRFSEELINGSLVYKTFRDLSIQPTVTHIGHIQPLSEAEALSFWDQLSEMWSSIVQHFLLHSDDSLPQNIFDIWQSLLLVQGQLTESHQHLTTSPSQTTRIVLIVTQISLPRETSQAQARYLETISQLWAVMKNVFTQAWLPSPAERILASLLKKRFDLSNETVKNYWSQLCAELISVGVPTLLHVLHTKTLSQSEEEMEVTRGLWAVLAKNAGGKSHTTEDGSGDAPEEHWMNLVQLLVMPFGAWNMGYSEVEIWRMTLSRSVEAGARVFQPSHVVISVVLDTLGESKLYLLKNVPCVLDGLLSHLVSSPCTNATLKLLSIIDSVLQTSYSCFAEHKTWALECLRLIADLISQAADFAIIPIIAVMPNGLCKWIADEDSVLTDSEHRDVINTVYGKSLERLSSIEPSLDRLCALANFLYSAFVRVQIDGLLSFEKFWRSTYHQNKGVSKKDYPLAIRACLKAWSDVCDDSFADEISLGSGSQSLESYTIPDSQLSPEKENDVANVLNDDMRFGTGKGIVEASDDESSQEIVTPKAKQHIVLSSNSISDSRALLALREYRSNPDTTLDEHVSDKATRSDLKRRSLLNVPRTPKRRRIEPSPSLEQTSSRKNGPTQVSVSEPVTRVSSVSPLPPTSNSQPSVQQNPRKREETSSWIGGDLKWRRGTMTFLDDYDTWEQNVLTGEFEVIEDNLPITDETMEHESEILISPSLGQLRKKRKVSDST